MQKLDLKLNTLDDLFEELEVIQSPPGRSSPSGRGVFVRGFFSGTGSKACWNALYGRVRSEPYSLIIARCCDGQCQAIGPVRQTSDPEMVALIATDGLMISSIRVALMPATSLTFHGVDILRSDLPPGKL